MMANKVLWSALGTYTAAIAGASVSPSLKNLAAAAQKIGNEIDLTGSGVRDMLAEWDLLVRFASSPSSGAYVSLYLIQAVDGSNYADGDDTIVPPQSAWVGNFLCRAVSTAQRVVLAGVRLPPTKFKPLIINNGSTGFTNTDNENVLSYRTYEPEIQ
jgi:hypothetical protein